MPNDAVDYKTSKERLYRAVLVDIRHRLRSDPPDFNTAVGEIRSVYDAANNVLMENGDGFAKPSETPQPASKNEDWTPATRQMPPRDVVVLMRRTGSEQIPMWEWRLPSETSEQLSSGDAIACISMALQNPPDTQEWARLLSDCRYVIEKLEDELLAAKRSRNDEQRLRKGAESHSIKATTIPSGCTSPACECGDITRCKANTKKATTETGEQPKNWAVWQCLIHQRLFAAYAGCSYCREGLAPTHDCNGNALKACAAQPCVRRAGCLHPKLCQEEQRCTHGAPDGCPENGVSVLL